MTIQPSFGCKQNTEQVELYNADLRLVLDAKTGQWREFTYLPLDLPLLAGQPRPALQVGLNREWLPGESGWQVKRIDCRADDKQVFLSLLLTCGDVDAEDRYILSADQALIRRDAKVLYRGAEKATFWGALFRLPAVRPGDPAGCTVLMPGQSSRSRIPLAEQAAIDSWPQPLSDLKSRQGIGCTPYGFLETAPDFTPAVVGVHNAKKHLGVICWFCPREDAASVAAEGFENSALAVTHHHRVEGWAHKDREYACGTQVIAIQPGDISDALAVVRSGWAELAGLESYNRSAGTVAPGQTAIYETSAQMEGGIHKLAEKLPALQKMGVNMLYLLPIWLGVRVTPEVFAADRHLAYRLDARWQRSRVPHRIISHDVIDPEAGTPEEMRAFVRQAHAAGMRVLFDYVFHGVAPESPLVQEKPHWFQRNLKGEMFPSHDWVPSLSMDWANPEVVDYFLKFAVRNIEEFDIDGYRIDAPFQKESNWAEGLPWRAGAAGYGGVRIVRKIREELQKIKPGAVLLCEMPGPVWDGTCDLCNDDPFLRMCLKVAQGWMKADELQTWLRDRVAVSVPGALRILSIENHNSTRVNPSSLAYRGSPVSRALFAICCFAGGVPLIWSGQEHGQEAVYAEYLRLRREYPALHTGETDFSARADSSDIFTAIRINSQENLIAAVNCGSRWDRVSIQLPGRLKAGGASLLWSSAVELQAGEIWKPANVLEFTTAPYAAYLFKLEEPRWIK